MVPTIDQEYAQRFKSEESAKSYRETHEVRSLRDLVDRRRFLGWVVGRAEIGAVRRALALCSGKEALDIPCGTGKMFCLLNKLGYSVIGVDASKQMLVQTERVNMESCDLVLGYISLIPLTRESVDVTICNRFLHRMPRDRRSEALKEIRRVTREYAVVYFGVRSGLTDAVRKMEELLRIGVRGTAHNIHQKAVVEELKEAGWHFLGGTHVIPLLSTGFVAVARKEVDL